MRRRAFIRATLVASSLTCSLTAMAGWFSGTPPRDLGLRDGRLKPCPDTPNCVSSQESGRAAIEPIAILGPPDVAWAKLAGVLEAMPGLRIVERSERYLRAEAVSRVFGFVDDVEFFLDPAGKLVHMRSASRIGYSDLGVNRRRIEDIRQRYSAAVSSP